MGALKVGNVHDFAVDFYDGSLVRSDVWFKSSDFDTWNYQVSSWLVTFKGTDGVFKLSGC